MTTKEKLAIMLEESDGGYLSGNTIAEKLNITRAAIWKNIKLLEADGYRIEAVTNKGYRLADDNDAVSVNCVKKYLDASNAPLLIEVRQSVTSTNTVLKENAATSQGWSALIAGNQSAGRGRSDRSFFSPADTGVYLSVLLRPDIPITDSGRLTTAAAVAACRAIEECTDEKPAIKWVNDVFVNEKKVCGILTEASVNFETGKPDWIVTGIGFNVYEPDGGFPEQIADIAGAVSQTRKKDLRSRLAAKFLQHFYRLCSNLHSPVIYEEYRARCFMIGQPIYVIRNDDKIPATALDINEDFALIVRYADGTKEVINAGEVSTRPV